METGFKVINDIIQYKYFIPKYQRGYRWTETNVLQLLGDIYENKLVDSMKFTEEQIKQIDSPKTHLRSMLEKVATEDDDTSVWPSKVKDLYCIQPLVVNKMDDNSYVVIDGQQRITTIAIMLAVLSFLEREIGGDKNNKDERKSRIFINYQSRPRSEELINALYEIKILDELRQNYSENIDFDYIIWAFETALKYYRDALTNFEKIFEVSTIKDYLEYLRFVLLHCVQFIWYDASQAVSSSNEQKVFANFNTGKLPLTNSELVKAIFMNPAYFGEEISGINSGINKIKDRQINISESWDRMETLLNDPEFWAFVPHPNQYHFLMNDTVTEKYEETRIDVIFDFFVRKNRISQSSLINDEYSTFIAIEKWILEKIEGKENKREIMDECWNEIKKIFSSLQELYEDKENNSKLYNLLGVYIYISNLRKSDGTYYVSLKSNNVVYNVESDIYLEIFDFLREVSETPRNERIVKVQKKLKNMIFGTSNVQKNIIGIRCYGTDDDKITLSLLLFNILKLNQSDGAGNRFNFLEFAKNTWQREHIFATENEGVPVDSLYRKSILHSITQALEEFDDVDTLKENPYIKYWNFIERGDEFSFPNKDEDGCKGDFERKIKFLKTSSDILLRYELLDNSKKITNLSDFTSSNRARLVEEIINYRDVNKFIFSELNILQYVNEAINKNQEKSEIADFKYSINEYIKKHIFLDCKVQIDNVFKAYSDEIPPYIFLTNVRENEDDLKSHLGKNIVATYKNKLRNLLWFTSEDREIINNASNVKEEFLKRKKMWKDKKYNEAIQVSNEETELYESTNDSQDYDEVIDEKYHDIINISNDDDLKFLINTVKLNNEEMRSNIERFFEKGGIYCKELTDNSMGNMSLLSGSVNSSIRNYSFYKKSEIVFKKSKNGSFIPLETLMVFTGAYNTDPVMVKEWSPKYRLNYIKELIDTLSMREVE